MFQPTFLLGVGFKAHWTVYVHEKISTDGNRLRPTMWLGVILMWLANTIRHCKDMLSLTSRIGQGDCW